MVTVSAIPIEEAQGENQLEVRAGTKPKDDAKGATKPTHPAAKPQVTASAASKAKANYDAVKHLTTKVGWHAFYLAWDKVEISNDPDM